MTDFTYRAQGLCAENVPVTQLVSQFGSPLYVYSKAAITRAWHAFDSALDDRAHLICYAVKANSNIALLNQLAQLGSGFDIVSVGELERVLIAGGDPRKIVFSGVAKGEAEIQRALEVGIGCFNVESQPELWRINQIAKSLNKIAPISLRINPDIDAKTHPYISTGLKENKFGVSHQMTKQVYHEAHALSHIKIKGIGCHIGSQLTELSPFLEATTLLLSLVDELRQEGITISHIDLGGGLGVCYSDETPPTPAQYIAKLQEKLVGYDDLTLVLEPGRAIVANAGILVTKVEYIKHQHDNFFAIVDAGMNDLLRPVLYGAWMSILPVLECEEGQPHYYNIVGPVCETGDFLGKQRKLTLNANSLLAVTGAGAYGFAMSSNYNSRPRVPEVLVDNDDVHLIRARESLADLWRGEQIIPFHE